MTQKEYTLTPDQFSEIKGLASHVSLFENGDWMLSINGRAYRFEEVREGLHHFKSISQNDFEQIWKMLNTIILEKKYHSKSDIKFDILAQFENLLDSTEQGSQLIDYIMENVAREDPDLLLNAAAVALDTFQETVVEFKD